MSSPVMFSPDIIHAIFGPEFAAALKAKETDREGSATVQGTDKATDDSGGGKSGNAASKSNLENFYKQHVEDNIDGVKPSKSLRASVPQQLTVDIGDDPLLPIRNYLRKKPGLPSLPIYAPSPPVADALGEIMNEKLQSTTKELNCGSHNQGGRLGARVAKFDVAAHFGSFVMTADRLGLTSQSNFSSVRANVCVFKGRWQYEIQLGSKGVMQVGWAQLSTKFSQEKGVGDTLDSYAFDGNRQRKWNGTTAPYGEAWSAGDIIGTVIDLEVGTMEFLRNGRNLGLAFSNIRRGPGIAYFPAISMAWGESVVADFGHSPLKFPVSGYFPIQAEVPVEDTKIPLLLHWLENTLKIFPTPEIPSRGLRLTREEYETIIVVTNRIFQYLAPSLNSAFIVEQTFLPFYARAVGLPEKVAIQDEVVLPAPTSHINVHLLLDLLWTFLEEAEMKKCIDRMSIVFLNCFRSNSLSLSYPFQIYSLRCLIALSSHRRTRRYLLHHILFDQIKLMHFLHIRPVDDEVLKVLMPNGRWKGKVGSDDAESLEYKNTCELLRSHIQAVEEVQTQFLRTLVTNSDGSETRPSSRSVFLRKFRAYIRDSIRPGALLQHPMNRALCGFFRVLKMTMLLWQEEFPSNDNNALPDLPISMFYDLTIDYHDSDRLGGVANYLYKTYHEEVSAALNVPDYMTGSTHGAQTTPMASFFGFQDFAGLAMAVGSASSPSVTTAESDALDSQSDVMSTVSVAGGNIRTDDAADPSHVALASTPSTADRDITTSVGVGVSSTTGIDSTASRSHAQPTVNAYRRTPALPSIADALPLPGAQTPQVGIIRPPMSNFITVSQTENVPNLRTASATSSAEDVTNVPRMTALIGGPSGPNLMIPVFDFPRDTAIRLLPGGVFGISTYDRVGIRPNNPASALVSRDSGVMDSLTSLRELLDDCIMIFSCGVKKHIEKIVTLRRNTEDYVKALDQANSELSRGGLSHEEESELLLSCDIFTQKLEEQSRHLGWIESGVFTAERATLAYELLKVVLNTLNKASAQGILFAFVPDFYVTTMIDMTWLLLTQFHPTVPYTDLPGIDGVLSEVAQFVSTHFVDRRITVAETKDTLLQALGAFICNKKMLSALEQMPELSKRQMVKYLLKPYDKRAWAQSNWMLVRFWQGSGFAFRYPNTSQARKAYRSGPQQDEFLISSNLPPNPSPIFQNLVGDILLENPKLASNFIHSVLNQLNWSFSEFVGLLQEIHTGANRNERAMMESRQLKVCSTTHELAQSLLRVLEMIVYVCPEVLTDFNREASETLLDRLCVLLSQVLNRIGTTSGIFAQVLELGISGIENISYFPILSSVAGVVVSLTKSELSQTDPTKLIATKAILQEPSFQVSSLDFLVGRGVPENIPAVLQFSLRKYVPVDITSDEVERLEVAIRHIANWAPRLEVDQNSISEEDICTICYAYAKSTTFFPCHHRSCRSCIVHHLMNRGECFFCKGVIEKVVDDSGVTIHDINAMSPDSESETTVESADQYI